MSSPVEIENTGTKFHTEVIDNDLNLPAQELQSKINDLEKEKKEIQDNFNTQRARLQKLYLQKEEELKGVTSEHEKLETQVETLSKELDEAKTQLFIAGIVKENEEAEKRKAQAEIATLNQIVQDTVEVSSTSQTEVKKLKQVIQLLESQINKLRGEKEKEGLLLAPSNMLSVTKTLARKVVGQLGNDPDMRPQDNLEDSMKKAQEDAEVLRSLVIPLEKRIQELTEKLRITDERLKRYEPEDILETTEGIEKKKSDKNLIDLSFNTSQGSGSYSAKGQEIKSPTKEQSELLETDVAGGHATVATVSPSKVVPCDMCVNYEAQLVGQQQLTKDLQKQNEIVKKNMERFKMDLIKETQFRKDMEDKWNEKKEEHKNQVTELKKMYDTAENSLKELQDVFKESCSEVKERLNSLTFDREKVNAQLDELQKENDKLVGKHTAHSKQLRSQPINFPNNVEELHLLLLRMQEELIAAKIAKETKEEEVNNLKVTLQLMRDQVNSELSRRYDIENNLETEKTLLTKQLGMRDKEKLKLENNIKELVGTEKELREQIKVLNERMQTLTKDKIRLEDANSELRSRVGSLQQELDTSETVQKDFVRLSQSLQIELEKIRGADTEVRWQHEEDVEECPGCRNQFSSFRKKAHCRHCGQLFCPTCLSHTVLSGPHQRPSRVCQVCHTLLNRETAPYFSQEPPHSPD